MANLNESLGTALERFEGAVRQVLEVQFDDLASEVLEIEASPYGRVVVQLGEMEAASFDGREVAIKPGSAPLPAAPIWAGDLTKYIKQFDKFWGAGDGVKAAAGSNGHKVVLKVGHAFGKKFKPWEAVKAADKIGKIREGRRGGHRCWTGGVRRLRRRACCREGRASPRGAAAQHHPGDPWLRPTASWQMRFHRRRRPGRSLQARVPAHRPMANEIHGARTTRSEICQRLDFRTGNKRSSGALCQLRHQDEAT